MLRVIFCTTAVVLFAATFQLQPRAAPQVPSLTEKFQAAIADAKSAEARDAAARAFVKTLNQREQIALGQALVASGQPDHEVFGAALLVDRGREQDAAPAYARFVTRGGDMTAHFWKWLHGGDPKTAVRAYIAIARALLAQIDTLTGEPRRRAEAFLVDAGVGRPITAYSRAAVEDRLKALERDIR